MNLCPWGSLFMNIFYWGDLWRFSLWRIFYSWRFFLMFFFFFWNFVLWDFSIVKICSMLILRLKNWFSLLVLRLKIFVLVIGLRAIGLGLDFKMDANSRLELGILIDLGSDLKFEIISRLWLFIWAGFLHNWVDFVVSWCVSEIWVWLLLCDHGYDWVCLIEMGMAKLDWFCWNFATFEANDPFFFYIKNFVFLIFLSLVD